ncbi:MAG TPA: glycosyltransferase [Dongiaceae bacterium]|nr:glycosyltransferase [Dongiaceae bacterium]
MKILFLATHLFPDTQFGGVVHCSQALGLELRCLLPQVRFLCVSPRAPRAPDGNPLHPECYQTSRAPRWGYAPGLRRRLREVVAQADVVFINGITTYPAVQAAWACRGAGRPFVVAPRGGLVPGNTRIKPLRKWFYHRLVDRPNLRRAAAIVGTSEVELQITERFGIRRPMALVPNGANLPPDGEYRPEDLPAEIGKLDPQAPLVLFLGRVHPYKNLGTLLRAWAEATKSTVATPPFLALAGAEDRAGYVARLRNGARTLGIEKTVRFLGEVVGPSKWALLRRASLLVLPSHSENFGSVVLEALASHTPVLASTGTPWQELETCRAGLWVPPSKEALAAGLCKLLSLPPEERLEWGARGGKLACERYAWPVQARKLVRVLQLALAGHAIPRYPHPIPLDAAGRAVLDDLPAPGGSAG